MYKGHVDIRMGGRYRDELDAVPTEVIDGIIYDENEEWTSTKVEEAGLTIDFDNLVNPQHGAKSIKIGIVADTETQLKGALTSVPVVGNTGYARHFDLSEPETEFPILLADIFPEHKTEVLGDGTRNLIYYSIPGLSMVSVIIKNRVTEEEIRLRIKTYDTEMFGFVGIDQEIEIPREVVFTNHLNEVPEGEYDFIINGMIRNDQLYTVGGMVFIPTVAAAILTAQVAEACNEGNLLFSIKPSAAIASNFGLSLKIYSGGDLKGELIINNANLHGFNPASTEYQAMSLPVSSFGAGIDTMTKLVISPVGEWPSMDLFIDYIILQVTQEKVTEDKYVESVTLEEVNNQLPLTISQTGGVPDKTVVFGTMAAKTFWTGTQAAYEAIAVKDANTIYMTEVV